MERGCRQDWERGRLVAACGGGPEAELDREDPHDPRRGPQRLEGATGGRASPRLAPGRGPEEEKGFFGRLPEVLCVVDWASEAAEAVTFVRQVHEQAQGGRATEEGNGSGLLGNGEPKVVGTFGTLHAWQAATLSRGETRDRERNGGRGRGLAALVARPPACCCRHVACSTGEASVRDSRVLLLVVGHPSEAQLLELFPRAVHVRGWRAPWGRQRQARSDLVLWELLI